MRDLNRVVRSFARREKQRIDHEYLVASAWTCEIINLLGSAYSSKEKPWKLMKPSDFFESWTGTSTKPVIDQEYVEAVLEAIKEREASVMFMGQNGAEVAY